MRKEAVSITTFIVKFYVILFKKNRIVVIVTTVNTNGSNVNLNPNRGVQTITMFYRVFKYKVYSSLEMYSFLVTFSRQQHVSTRFDTVDLLMN